MADREAGHLWTSDFVTEVSVHTREAVSQGLGMAECKRPAQGADHLAAAAPRKPLAELTNREPRGVKRPVTREIGKGPLAQLDMLGAAEPSSLKHQLSARPAADLPPKKVRLLPPPHCPLPALPPVTATPHWGPMRAEAPGASWVSAAHHQVAASRMASFGAWLQVEPVELPAGPSSTSVAPPSAAAALGHLRAAFPAAGKPDLGATFEVQPPVFRPLAQPGTVGVQTSRQAEPTIKAEAQTEEAAQAALAAEGETENDEEMQKVLAALHGPSRKRRPRRWLSEAEKTHHCGINGCTKAYGSASSLCAHKRAHHPEWKPTRAGERGANRSAAGPGPASQNGAPQATQAPTTGHCQGGGEDQGEPPEHRESAAVEGSEGGAALRHWPEREQLGLDDPLEEWDGAGKAEHLLEGSAAVEAEEEDLALAGSCTVERGAQALAAVEAQDPLSGFLKDRAKSLVHDIQPKRLDWGDEVSGPGAAGSLEIAPPCSPACLPALPPLPPSSVFRFSPPYPPQQLGFDLPVSPESQLLGLGGSSAASPLLCLLSGDPTPQRWFSPAAAAPLDLRPSPTPSTTSPMPPQPLLHWKWLQLLAADARGRLETLQRSRARVQLAIEEEAQALDRPLAHEAAARLVDGGGERVAAGSALQLFQETALVLDKEAVQLRAGLAKLEEMQQLWKSAHLLASAREARQTTSRSMALESSGCDVDRNRHELATGRQVRGGVQEHAPTKVGYFPSIELVAQEIVSAFGRE